MFIGREAELQFLNDKYEENKQKAKFYYALFSENGFDEKIESAAEENDVRLYTLEDIVNYLNP